MRHPYGPGLLIPPRGFRAKLAWVIERAIRMVVKYWLRPFDRAGLHRLRITRLIWAKDCIGRGIRRYTVLHAPQSVDIARPSDAQFLQACRHYASGVLQLGEVFVCEVSPALYCPWLGLVANEHFEVFGDSVLLPHRFELSPAHRDFRPWRCARRKGPVSSVQRIDAYNFWHWMADCLPQVLTLEKYMQAEPLTLLAADDLGRFQRETLSLVLPSTMSLEFVPGKTWIKTDRFILPSYLSGSCNGYLPEDYYAEIRTRITRRLGLPDNAKPESRIYLSRGGARRRRVENEAAIIESLARYGFVAVRPEAMPIREQVELFQRAEVIVAPHGAALGAMVFAPRAKVLVLYPERHPGEYFYTMARRLGVDHYGLVHDSQSDEDSIDNFVVDQGRMEAMLEGPMGLSRPPAEPTPRFERTPRSN
ncbi:MAG: glycosyltransferase family 61 protein [Pseudomonadota bacterium]|nr:glycosyltransferase family 61 protein [Pseudomonadota bacterium]